MRKSWRGGGELLKNRTLDGYASWLPQELQNQIPGLFRTFLGRFPGLLKVFLQDLKFNFDYYSFMHLLFCTCD